MNKNIGKLLILGGFGLKALSSFISFVTNYRIIDLGSAIFGIGNIASMLAYAAVAAGFVVLFIADRDIIDLAIACCVGIQVFVPFISNILQGGAVLYSVANFLFLGAMLVWAYRMYTTAPIATIAIAGSTAFSFIFPIILSAVGSDPFTVYMLNLFVGLIVSCCYAGAAFLYYRG